MSDIYTPPIDRKKFDAMFESIVKEKRHVASESLDYMVNKEPVDKGKRLQRKQKIRREYSAE